MAKEEYAEALKNALIEIRNICPDINNSFIFTKEGAIIAGDSEVADTTVKTTLNSFQNIAEKAEMMGGISSFSVDGVQGRVYISHINDMYLATATSKKVDENYVRSVTQVIIPTILKLLESINPTPLKSTQSQQLVVEAFSGFFTGDTVQVDPQLLNEWSELFSGQNINEIEIRTPDGETTRCKVKEITDSSLQGKGIIRMPDRVCRTLDVNKGESVIIKPLEP
jgi:predicted regulator of Ras-like GTPase activity (Roadblock/LC7/MglB family)